MNLNFYVNICLFSLIIFHLSFLMEQHSSFMIENVFNFNDNFGIIYKNYKYMYISIVVRV